MDSKGWERVRTARLGESNASRSPEAAQLRQASSQTVRLGPVQPRPLSHRTIVCNYREANLLVRFKVNSVLTTKYNILIFVPKGLFEQFRRVINLYFLMISILSTTPISPVSPVTNVVPLPLVLLVSLIKEAFEDWVKHDEFFSADLLFLASTNPDGVCYIETANLYGETNLKIRKALERTWYCIFPEKAAEFKANGLMVLWVCHLCAILLFYQVTILTMFTLITLYSTVIPISLYVSVEMIKFIQCPQFINKDLRMYHADTNTSALARTSNLNEELGQIQKSDTAAYEKGFNFNDDRIMCGAWKNERDPEICMEFFRCLALCHTVLPEGDESLEKIVYQAASPDEAALVTAAKHFGFSFKGNTGVFIPLRAPTTVMLCESHVERMGNIQDVSYEILNVLEFNSLLYDSTRKRQSVGCRYPNGRLVIYCKGADTVIYERLADASQDIKRLTREHSLVHQVAEMIEKDLILIGCTAIEDKLQEGVPDIETLSRAGIKIWVLTGDKLETAINIAYACNLINNDMKQFIITSETDAIREVEEKGDPVEISQVIRDSVSHDLKRCLEEAQEGVHIAVQKLVLVIDGKCLMYALDPNLCVNLLKLSLNCSSVVCCRVSPLQKAQSAHVGVGISGLEGMQAVMASDFAIAQFRFLKDLLLVHGRWSYIRLCKRFYDDWFQSLYNVDFTALPVIILGLFDKDVSASLAKKYPQLYQEGITNTYFKWGVVAVWDFFAFYQSLIFYYFTTSASENGHNSSAKIFSLWDVSTMAFTCVVVTVNLRLLMACNSVTRWHRLSILGSILAWFVFIFIYSGVMTPNDRQENIYFAIYVLQC
ncbi:hypothetical protein ZIOFF_028937 [Zingiber officinale]|uniref:Phospholipid-transporting ATPase n=1 Tax=Zingiber officinale TaxID=94328 RepID=A0A8J5GQP8_ZINOF|nr:hypothetical protein ZIOFF_028937 [Zingiber officinale]